MLREKVYLCRETPGQLMHLDFDAVAVRCCQSFKVMNLMTAYLPYSRYLYAAFFDELLTTEGLATLLDDCFEHIGGVPTALELNLDRLILVTKYGENLLEKDNFKHFANNRGFEIRFNQKGITHFMKAVKNKYVEKHFFMEDWIWDGNFSEWLREYNRKPKRVNTKEIPAYQLDYESLYLKPLRTNIKD